MGWDISSLVVLVVAIIAVIAGVSLWASRHDILSSSLIAGGLLVGLFAVPEMASQETVHTTAFWRYYTPILQWLDHWNWLILLIGGLLLVVDGFFACAPDWSVSPSGIPTRAAGTGVQFQRALYCFLTGGTLIAIAWIARYQEYEVPDADAMYFSLKEATQGSAYIQVALEVGKPVEIVQAGSSLPEAEANRWKQLVQEECKNREGLDIVVDKIHSVTSRASKGKAIDLYIVEFTGKVDNADPATDEDLKQVTYDVKSNLDYDATKTWVEELVQKQASLHLQATTTPSTTATSVPTAGRGPAISPPKRGPFGKRTR